MLHIGHDGTGCRSSPGHGRSRAIATGLDEPHSQQHRGCSEDVVALRSDAGGYDDLNDRAGDVLENDRRNSWRCRVPIGRVVGRIHREIGGHLERKAVGDIRICFAECDTRSVGTWGSKEVDR